MLSQPKIPRGLLLFVAVLYGVELLDEFIGGLFVPLLGGIVDSFGLQTAMWLLISGPIALIWGVR
jgi:hypothetical protein